MPLHIFTTVSILDGSVFYIHGEGSSVVLECPRVRVQPEDIDAAQSTGIARHIYGSNPSSRLDQVQLKVVLSKERVRMHFLNLNEQTRACQWDSHHPHVSTSNNQDK